LKLKCCFCEETWNPKKGIPRACPICKRYFVKQKPEVLEE